MMVRPKATLSREMTQCNAATKIVWAHIGAHTVVVNSRRYFSSVVTFDEREFRIAAAIDAASVAVVATGVSVRCSPVSVRLADVM